MKVWNYMAIMLVMMIFLTFMGFDLSGVSNGDNSTLSTVGININQTSPEDSSLNIAGSSWLNILFNKVNGLILILGATAGAVIVGLFGKTIDLKLAIGVGFFSAFTLKFLSFAWALLIISDAVWLDGIIITVFGALSGMFIFSIVEWFAGGDN